MNMWTELVKIVYKPRIKMKRLALIGTKEFSEQIIFFARRTGEFDFVGYFDDLVEKGTIINGYPVLGKVEEAERRYSSRHDTL